MLDSVEAQYSKPPASVSSPPSPTRAADTPAWFLAYLEARYTSLMQEVNEVRRMLGRNPKRCPHCGGELK